MRPIRNFRTATTSDEGEVAGPRSVCGHWDRNAPLPDTPQAVIGWHEARDTVISAYRDFSPEMAEIAQRFFDRSWIDVPARPGKAPGAFAHPTVPSAHPLCSAQLSWASRAMS
jgi:oligoendopeptidase F